MKNILVVFSLCLLSTYAYSFETGVYHGENATHTQMCDFNIVQNANSVTVNQFECKDLETTMTMTLEAGEYQFGHYEQTDAAQGISLVADLSANSMNYFLKSLSTSDTMTETITVKGKGVIHYTLKFASADSQMTAFDFDLTKK